MDSKRKATVNGAGAQEVDDRASKRRKPDIDLSHGETVETTAQYGLDFIEQVKRTQDKSKRLVATNFLTLPSKRQLPEYYKIIKMPIALDTIEEKLQRREFPNLTSLESYFKRMISNAKEFNEKGSEIYDDAERIRKALSNFMTKHNPAYKTAGYVAFPTPIPAEPQTVVSDDAAGSDEDAEGEIDEEIQAPPSPLPRRRGRPPKNSSNIEANGQRSSTTPALTDSQYVDVGYSSLSFQQAQEKIIADMLGHKEDEDDDYPAFEPFFVVPPKSLKDYYQVIPNPTSIKQIQKTIRGSSPFKTWKAFEEEVAGIWHNAWHYNEDGSEISLLAKDLEVFFNKRLAQAKQTVSEPPQHKLKLKVSEPPKITLRMGVKASPADSPAGTPGLSGLDSPQIGTAPRRNPFGGSQSSAVPSLSQLDRARSMSGSVDSPTPSLSSMVKNEDMPKQSPSVPPSAASLVQGAQNGHHQMSSTTHLNGNSMLPPTGSSLPSYGLSYFGASGQTPSYGQLAHHNLNQTIDSKWRQPRKDASDAMITNLSLATHPGLNITRHFRMDLPPSPTMAQQSITINLPSTHYYLQIKPTIAAPLLDRQHKLFVTSGQNRLHAMPTIPGHPIDPRHPLFEARLLPGVNRIEIELIAALPKGASKPANGQDVELEKITIFANLLRS